MKTKCDTCDKPLTGRQRKYCSRVCANKEINRKYKSYASQCSRGKLRRQELIRLTGGECSICGYSKNQSALAFHHKIPRNKSFAVDIRQCSNRSWDTLVKEVNKCALYCHNCHNELHHPNLALPVPLLPATLSDLKTMGNGAR